MSDLGSVFDVDVLPRLLGPLRRGRRRALLRRAFAAAVGEDIDDVGFGCGAVYATSVTRFFKIPVTPRSPARREPAAWTLARQRAELARLVVVGDVVRGMLVTPRQRPAPTNVDVAPLLRALAAMARPGSLDGADLPELRRGLALAGRAAERFAPFRQAPVAIGPQHGDVHAGNVVVGDDGQLRLIDLGELRLQGAHDLDVIGAAVEAEARLRGTSWIHVVHEAGALPLASPVLLPAEARAVVYGCFRLGGLAAWLPRRQLLPIVAKLNDR